MAVSFTKLGQYGRFGNALFQIAATIGYAKKHNETFSFPRWPYQNNIKLGKLGCFTDIKNIKTKSKYEEPCFDYREIPYQEDLDLFGYFQSYKYFSHCDDFIKELLMPVRLDDPDLFRGICAIHVRRTDYLKYPDHHPFPGMDYYKKAMAMIPQAKKFLIFSDDLLWCKNNFKDLRCIIPTEMADSITDFKMMTACQYHIIANSSFSWWSAYLSEPDERVVISPKTWFGPVLSPTHPTNNFIPQGWISL